mmetsp:Transcript_8368/g.25089  ORF Transcript_8368/g.25089 Transcript_8368/m.25089 type:complete len:91 (+) Transcript_8368:1419-1691(+)
MQRRICLCAKAVAAAAAACSGRNSLGALGEGPSAGCDNVQAVSNCLKVTVGLMLVSITYWAFLLPMPATMSSSPSALHPWCLGESLRKLV